jgi:hypothetical protein
MVAWELGQKIELPRFTDAEGRVRYAEGVGIAAICDIVDFLHYAAVDEAGALNPLAGSVNRTLGFGYSQTARLLKTMMIEGFNYVDGRRVWVARNQQPPPSTLMPLESRPDDETVLPAPAHLPNAVVQVPRRGADGNFIGGVRLPDVEVPLGVHGVQNRPLSDRSCNLSAAYIAFAKKPDERRPGDMRLAISERYKGRADYLNRIRVATRRLIEQRFLLPEDGAIIIHTAAQSPAFD